MVTREKTVRRDTITRKKSKRKLRFRIILFWIKLLLALGLITAIFMLLALSSIFNISRFTVDGSSHYDKENIIARSGISMGSNGFKSVSGKPLQLLTLRCGRAEKDILKSCPYLKNATVRFALPDTIKIKLEERKPAFIASYFGTSLVLDAEGYVVDASRDVPKLKLPLIEGLKLDSFETGKRINASNNEKLEKAAALQKAVESADKEEGNKISGLLTGINVKDTGKVTMVIDLRVTVILGDLTDLDYRLLVTKQVFFKNIKKGEKGVLDFTSGQNPIFKPQAN